MGWLADRVLTHVYENKETGEQDFLELPAKEDRPDVHNGFPYKETLPFQLNLVTRVQFEMNGRIGYKISEGGKSRVVSATREKYEHNLGNASSKRLKEMGDSKAESVYSKGYQRKLDDKKRNDVEASKAKMKRLRSK